MVERVLAEQAAAVADFKSGQSKAMGFLIGQVMQASAGKANPKVIKELITQKLSA
jgi:aspartyl-tRNA(Asn)/glutamyl-tRNA(Gln) amidotransferase subunit B